MGKKSTYIKNYLWNLQTNSYLQVIWAMDHTQSECFSAWHWQVLANKALKHEELLVRKRYCPLFPLSCSWQWTDTGIFMEAALKVMQSPRKLVEEPSKKREKERLWVLFFLIPPFLHQHTHPLCLTLHGYSVMLNQQSKQVKRSHVNKKVSGGLGRWFSHSDERPGVQIPTIHTMMGGHGNLPAIPASGGWVQDPRASWLTEKRSPIIEPWVW